MEKRVKTTELGLEVGRITNFGLLGFDYRAMGFNPRTALQTATSPGLFIFGEHDILVIPDKNIERLHEIFGDDLPDNLSVAVAERAAHDFRLVDTPCHSYNEPTQYEQSAEVIEVLNGWLAEQGY